MAVLVKNRFTGKLLPLYAQEIAKLTKRFIKMGESPETAGASARDFMKIYEHQYREFVPVDAE